jgi:hypothetical protein
MKSVKVFCVTKDEYDLIEDFILYYGYIFGYENLIIIDNNSTNQQVLDIYEKYIPKGITLFKEPSYEGNGQAVMFNKYMNMYKNYCDFMLGLDTDEFLVSIDQINESKDASDRDVIRKMFDEFPENYTLFSVGIYPHSIPDPESSSYSNQKINRPARDIITFKYPPPPYLALGYIAKHFVRSNAFLETFVGNHVVHVSKGDSMVSRIGYLHLTTTGQRRVYERAMNIVKGYNYIDVKLDRNTQINELSTLIVGVGFHRVDSYKSFLLRSFILDMFIKYIKRAPSTEELQRQVEIYFKNSTQEIEQKFFDCDESKRQKNILFFMDENEKNNIIFYDAPLSKCPHHIIIIDSVSKRLKNLTLN